MRSVPAFLFLALASCGGPALEGGDPEAAAREPIEAHMWRSTCGDDGEVPVVTLFDYDEAGRQVATLKMKGHEVLQTATFGYDKFGRIDLAEYDRWGDGDIDRTVSYEYNPLGRLDMIGVDLDRDGEPEIVKYTVFNKLGQRVALEVDRDDDGKYEALWTYAWEDWHLDSLTYDGNADGKVDGMSDFVYDDEGRLARRIDHGWGRPMRDYTYEYEGDHLVHLEWWSPKATDHDPGSCDYDWSTWK